MASINVTNINILDNPGYFTDPLKFEITFECVRDLQSDLEWKVTYVGSAESEKYDQVLDSVLVGPIPLGVNRFVFQTPPPDHTKIPKQDLLGVTVCLLSCLYKDKEFIRIGYYVNNEYEDTDALIYVNKKVPEQGVEEEMDIDKSEGEEEEDDDEEDDAQGEGAEDQGESDVEEEQNDNEEAAEEVKTEEKPESENENKGNTNRSTLSKQSEKKQEVNKPEEQPAKPVEERIEQEVILPDNYDIKKIKRSILADKPRVTRFAIDWDEPDAAAVPAANTESGEENESEE